jgi:hypothetical protein
MPSPPWRLIHSGTLNGALNMALDQALLEAVAAGLSPRSSGCIAGARQR